MAEECSPCRTGPWPNPTRACTACRDNTSRFPLLRPRSAAGALSGPGGSESLPGAGEREGSSSPGPPLVEARRSEKNSRGTACGSPQVRVFSVRILSSSVVLLMRCREPSSLQILQPLWLAVGGAAVRGHASPAIRELGPRRWRARRANAAAGPQPGQRARRRGQEADRGDAACQPRPGLRASIVQGPSAERAGARRVPR